MLVTEGEVRHDNYLILVCAFNEAGNLKQLLPLLERERVLIVDDGSTDQTSKIAVSMGFRVLTHHSRMGKLAGLRDGVDFARKNGYAVMVDLGADAIPEPGSIEKLVRALESDDVGGASARQIPVRAGGNLAYRIDDVIWSVLANGKRFQMKLYGDSYLGAVMFAFKVGSLDVMAGTNDDEIVGAYLRSQHLRIVYVEDAVVLFDASSSLHHILDRRVRMNFGHMVEHDSGAPTATFAVAAIGLIQSGIQSGSRVPWILPAVALECLAKLWAWNDFRKRRFDKYSRWVSPDKSKTPLNISSSRSG